LPKGAGDAQAHAHYGAEDQGGHAEPQTGRKTLADDVQHRPVLIFQRGPEIAVGDVAEIGQVLDAQRLVQAILGLQIVLDLGGQFAVGVEGSARRRAHHEEGDGDDQKQCRKRDEKAAEQESQH